jgi:hypothetical protein
VLFVDVRDRRGDGALALFIPGFAGSEHTGAAISAARDLTDRERRA